MWKFHVVPPAQTADILKIIKKIVERIENKVLVNNMRLNECEELKLLKEKCCDESPIIAIEAFQAIKILIQKKILIKSQAISLLISLLPSVKSHSVLVNTISSVLLTDLWEQVTETGEYECPYTVQVQHPLVMVLKCNQEVGWYEIHQFTLQLLQEKHLKMKHKLKLLRPLFRQVFWCSFWKGSKFQMQLFDTLMLESHKKHIMSFALEALLWKEMDMYYCMYLEHFLFELLQKESYDEAKSILAGLTPMFAQCIKWLIANGLSPNFWLESLKVCIGIDASSNSTVLFILSDIVMQMPSLYINLLVDICKSIIFSTNCNKYVVYKFIAVMLNWFVDPSFLATPLYKTFEEILEFTTARENKWNDQTHKLSESEYFKVYGSNKMDTKFIVDLILISNSWPDDKTSIENWLRNLMCSNKDDMLCSLHSFIHGIILCENSSAIIKLCLDMLLNVVDKHKDISFSLLRLLFFKLGTEVDPNMQRKYLFSLPKLSVKKENISLIVGIIESLKRGHQKIMTPLVIQLYLSLWKYDNRTFSYLHKMLHESTSGDLTWEVNVSKAIALKEICRLAPHLHAKDLVGVLSGILNECSGNVSGLPSAIAIEAVTELCKAYVIDVAGTWNAIQPKLRVDKRPKVIMSLCKFFGEIPNISSSGQKNEQLFQDVVPMLWNYTFFEDAEIVRNAFRALSNFPVEDLPLKIFPEIYRMNIKIPKDLDKNSKSHEDILSLPYVPAECWVQFLAKIDEEVLQDGGDLVIVLIEKELTSMPRGLFYNPPEKSEPLSYSYLPPRSICRGLTERLLKHSKEIPTSGPKYLKEIIRVLSHEYSKLLPPLNWGFLENLMILGPKFLLHSLALLAKQGSISSSARSVLESYFKSVEWDCSKLEDVLFIYNLLPLLFKSLSYSTMQSFLDRTIALCLDSSLNKSSLHVEKILEKMEETLRSKSVQPSHKNAIAKQLEKVLSTIPPLHEVMKVYARCATEFPVKLLEEITSVKDVNNIDRVWLRRAIIIRSAIAMRSDIKNPLVWLNELTEAVAHFPQEKNFVMHTICSIIRNRRACDHRTWIEELMWRIQDSITSSTGNDSNSVTFFLMDVFVTAITILSDFDILFVDLDEFIENTSQKVEVFPHALSDITSQKGWDDMLPTMGLWLQKLCKWKHLPPEKLRVFVQALLMMRELKLFTDETGIYSLFDIFSLPFL